MGCNPCYNGNLIHRSSVNQTVTIVAILVIMEI